MQSNQSQSHKTISQTKWEDFEKRVWKYYEHLWYEVIYHGFEKWLKDGWIDLIVKKLWEKTKYIQCKNLKKQIDYDKIAWIYWRVVDELKFNVEFVIWANNWFDYGANKFAESKWIALMSWGDLIWVEKEDNHWNTICNEDYQ
jgi:Holliday junction resolvase-like predicted endonuclease